MILSSYPTKVLQEEDSVDKAGNIVPGAETLVFKQCTATGVGGYYTYLQGTSMASPHAAGQHACPQPRTQTYQREDRRGQFNAYCEGDEEYNGF